MAQSVTTGTAVWCFPGLSCSACLEVEEIVERLACAVRARRRRFAFDRRARRVERARVPVVLRRHTCGDRLHALETAARVEGRALGTGVEIGAAPGTPRVVRDVQ